MIRKPGVGVVDYGSGNVASLWQTLRKIGYRPTLLRKAEDFDAAKVIIIPGVGDVAGLGDHLGKLVCHAANDLVTVEVAILP